MTHANQYANENRVKALLLRLTPAEYRAIKSSAKGLSLTMAGYIRRRIFQHLATPEPTPTTERNDDGNETRTR